MAGDIDSGKASDFESPGHCSESDSEIEDAEQSEASEVAIKKKRKRSKAKKARKGREDVKAMRKSTNTFHAQATGEKNQQRAVSEKSGRT